MTINRWLWFNAAATLLLFLAGVALAVFVFLNASQNRAALCNLRGDLERRVQATQDYLDAHPGPEPIPGIPRGALVQQLANQQRTIDSLSNLDC